MMGNAAVRQADQANWNADWWDFTRWVSPVGYQRLAIAVIEQAIGDQRGLNIPPPFQRDLAKLDENTAWDAAEYLEGDYPLYEHCQLAHVTIEMAQWEAKKMLVQTMCDNLLRVVARRGRHDLCRRPVRQKWHPHRVIDAVEEGL